MKCHNNCGWCCIKFSISPCDQLPEGKEAGIVCKHLTKDKKCAIHDNKPEECKGVPANLDMCGTNPNEAEKLLDKYI